MSGSDYAALIKATHASLSNSTYGRDSRHAMGSCTVCKMHVCLTHHSHTQGR